MTEKEWLACSPNGSPKHVVAMLTFLGPRLSRRKQVLVACGSFYRHRETGDRYELPWERPAREVAERYVDGTATLEDIARVRAVVEKALADDPYPNDLMHNTLPDQGGKALNLFRLATGELNSFLEISGDDMPYLRPFPFYGSEPREEDLLRDVFGNPFAPIPVIDPAWLTSTVTALAKGIYEERAFDRMPILADALQDAGCTDEAILTHCRGSGPLGGMGAIPPCNPHIRGCWVIDLLLGKT